MYATIEHLTASQGHLIIIKHLMKHIDVKTDGWMSQPGVRTRLYNCRLGARSS